MSGFWTGALNAASSGVEGYAQGQDIATQRAIMRAAMKRKEDDDARREKLAQDEFDFKKQQTDVENRMKGYTPASTTVTTEDPGSADAAPAPKLPTESSFDDVMGQLGQSNGMPTTAPAGPLDAPPKPSLGGIPQLKVINTPESFDPMGGTQGAIAGAKITAATAARQQTLDSLEARNAANNKSRELVAHLRAANRAAGNGPREMTANAKERNARQAAQGFLAIHGDLTSAREWLASPDGTDARAQGVTPMHLEIAAGLRQEGDTHAAMGIARTANPARAVEKVRAVRAAANAPPGTMTPPSSPDLAAQRAAYDAAAAAAKASGRSVDALGPRP